MIYRKLFLFAILTLIVSGFSVSSAQTHPPVLEKNTPRPSLAQRLGFSATDKVLIVNGDDVAVSRSSNAAAINAMEKGLMTSGTVMVVSSWFPQIAAYARSHPKSDLGVHLTVTSEWEYYRWGPVSDKIYVPNLIDPMGYLWKTVTLFKAHATPEEAEYEARAQIEMAYRAGIDVTHIDSHMLALTSDAEYYEVFIKLAKEFDLPVRMPSQVVLESNGLGHLREKLAAAGVLCPDSLLYGRCVNNETIKECWIRLLRSLQAGVTEVFIHAALPTDEMEAITGEWELTNWRVRAMEYELFTHDAEIRALLQSQNIKLIGYRALRTLQHRERQAAGK